MNRAGWSAVVALVTLCLGAGTALAHGETVKTDPKNKAEVAMPNLVSVTLTEPPTPDSRISITDGCGQEVASNISVKDETLRAAVGDAQPGRWRAAYSVISAVDGHLTEDDWSFTVEGAASCGGGGGDEAEPTETPPDEDGAETDADDDAPVEDDGARAADTDPASDSDDGGFPVLPVVIGAVAVVGLAALVRAKTAG